MCQDCFRYWLVASRHISIIWTNANTVHWHICVNMPEWAINCQLKMLQNRFLNLALEWRVFWPTNSPWLEEATHTHTHDALCWVGIVWSNDLLGLWESLLQHTFCCMLQWFWSAYDPFPTSAAPLWPPRSGSAPALLPVHAGSPRPGGQTTTDFTWRISNTLQQRRIHSWWHVRLWFLQAVVCYR